MLALQEERLGGNFAAPYHGRVDTHDGLLQGSIQQGSLLTLGSSVVGGCGIHVHLSALKHQVP
jgi:hypothetical protein